MTDHITENARLRAALAPFADESLHVGPEHDFVAVPIAACDAARAALATPAPDTRKEVMPDDEAANPADARHEASPGVTAGADYAAGFADGTRQAWGVVDATPMLETALAWPYCCDAESCAYYGVTIGDALRDAILALTPGDPVAAAARVLLDSDDAIVAICQAIADMPGSSDDILRAALRAIAESEAGHE